MVTQTKALILQTFSVRNWFCHSNLDYYSWDNWITFLFCASLTAVLPCWETRSIAWLVQQWILLKLWQEITVKRQLRDMSVSDVCTTLARLSWQVPPQSQSTVRASHFGQRTAPMCTCVWDAGGEGPQHDKCSSGRFSFLFCKNDGQDSIVCNMFP